MAGMYFTPPQVAKLLKVRRDKVIAWITSGKLHAIDVGGDRSQYRISQSDLDAFALASEVKPPQPAPRHSASLLRPGETEYYR